MQHADEIVLLFLLLDAVQENYLRSTVQLIVGRFCLMAFLTLLGMSVLGSRMAQAQYPFFAITTISQPFSTQRADALYLLVFVMLCVLRITLYTSLAVHLLHQQFPKLRYVSTICLLIMLAISWAVGIVPVSGMWNLLTLGVFVLLIQIGFLVAQKKEGLLCENMAKGMRRVSQRRAAALHWLFGSAGARSCLFTGAGIPTHGSVRRAAA